MLCVTGVIIHVDACFTITVRTYNARTHTSSHHFTTSHTTYHTRITSTRIIHHSQNTEDNAPSSESDIVWYIVAFILVVLWTIMCLACFQALIERRRHLRAYGGGTGSTPTTTTTTPATTTAGAVRTTTTTARPMRPASHIVV
jgi:hypothetical protein